MVEIMEEIKKTSKAKLVASALIPIVILVGMIVYIFGPGADLLNFGIPLPEISIEKIDFLDSKIVVMVRNTGPIDVEIVQADVNDRIQPAAIEPDKKLERFESAKVIIPFVWNEAEPYEIGLTASDGTRFAKSTIAAHAQEPSFERTSYFAMIGTYVGVIPVLIGLLWFPFIARISKNKYKFFLALTAGLLLFLGIDSVVEGLKISTENLATSFNGQMLVATITIISFLGLYYCSEKLLTKTITSTMTKPVAISLMIAIGIGLHNLGEGLAIGAAISIGEIALSSFLIVGFTIHNTTEGFAIAAPMAQRKPMVGKLVAMGMIAGTPAIFGAWMGGFGYSPFAAIVFLSVGAGAIFQVVVSIINSIRLDGERTFSNAATAAGFGIGMLLMYLTSIMV